MVQMRRASRSWETVRIRRSQSIRVRRRCCCRLGIKSLNERDDVRGPVQPDWPFSFCVRGKLLGRNGAIGAPGEHARWTAGGTPALRYQRCFDREWMPASTGRLWRCYQAVEDFQETIDFLPGIKATEADADQTSRALG